MALNQIFQGIGAAPRASGQNQSSPLMDTLAAMNLQQLQDYATKHKNDAATVALVSSIANIKKKATAAEQAQPVNPQQPKIGEQVIAGIAPQPAPQPAPQAQGLPEDSGIAQIPAPNLQKMADGGIVAFEEGGEVPRFNGQTGSVPQALPGGLGIYGQGSFTPQVGATENQPWAQRKMDEIAAKVRAGTATTQEKAWISMFGGDALNRVSARETQATYQNAPNQLGGETARLAAQAKPIVDKTNVDTPIVDTADADKTRIDRANGPGNTGSGSGRPSQQLPGFPSVNAAANALTGIDTLLPAKETARAKEDFMTEREEVSKPVWAKAEGMINKEKDRLSEGREQDFYMALIEGGLAAAGASGPNALQNIAQGFSKGTSSYAAGLKDFRKAAQENSKMELDIERAKAAEKRGDMDAYQKYEDSIKNRNADIDKLKTSGLFQLASTNLSGQYSNESARISAAGSLAAAGAGARAGVDAQVALLEKLGAAKEGSALLTGLERKSQEDKIPRLYAEYTKLASDPMKGEDFMRKYPNFQTYLAGMGGAGKQGIIDIPDAAPNAAVRAR